MASGSRDVRHAFTNAVPRSVWCARCLGAGVGIVLGLALIADYGAAILRARHAATGSPAASNPLAAGCILLLGLAALATFQSRLAWRVAAQTAIGLALVLILARVSEFSSVSVMLAHLLPLGRPLALPGTPQRGTALDAVLSSACFCSPPALGSYSINSSEQAK